MIGKICLTLAIVTWLGLCFAGPHWITEGYAGMIAILGVGSVWSLIYTYVTLRFDS